MESPPSLSCACQVKRQSGPKAPAMMGLTILPLLVDYDQKIMIIIQFYPKKCGEKSLFLFYVIFMSFFWAHPFQSRMQPASTLNNSSTTNTASRPALMGTTWMGSPRFLHDSTTHSRTPPPPTHRNDDPTPVGKILATIKSFSVSPCCRILQVLDVRSFLDQFFIKLIKMC